MDRAVGALPGRRGRGPIAGSLRRRAASCRGRLHRAGVERRGVSALAAVGIGSYELSHLGYNEFGILKGLMRSPLALTGAIQAAREQTDALFRLVRPDSLYERTIPERHR